MKCLCRKNKRNRGKINQDKSKQEESVAAQYSAVAAQYSAVAVQLDSVEESNCSLWKLSLKHILYYFMKHAFCI